MFQFVSALRAVSVAALVGGYAWTCPATATADPNSDALVGMLSKGYSTSNCNLGNLDQKDNERGILAGYECGQNSLAGGPSKGFYVLFDNPSDAAKGFQELSSNLNMAPCTPGASTPDTWHYQSSPGTPAGKVACGRGDNGPGLTWTNDQNHMVGAITGSDVQSLYQWWLANG